jgi:prophage antirepressor-like protein
MDILKSFSLCGSDYPINIQGTIENPLFQVNQIGKLLNIKNIRNQTSKFNESQKVVCQTDTLGGIQNVTFLTEKGLYRIIGRSNKPIAEKFQNWVCDVIKEIRLTTEYKLKEHIENSEKDWDINKKLIINQAKLDIHSKLLELYHLKNVVYICKLNDVDDNKYIIKIGSTQNIKERINNISNNYGCIPLLLDIYECINHTKFESWIRTNPTIKHLFCSIKKKNGATTRETFLVNDMDYNIIIHLIKNEIKIFNQNPYEITIEKLIELEDKKKINFELEYKNEEKKMEVLQKIDEIKQHTLSENNVESKECNDSKECKESKECKKITSIIPILKTRQHTRSPKIYQYNPETLKLLNIYDSIIDVTRSIKGSSPSALKEACKKNTIYKYYRWLLVSRDIQKTTEIIVPPTVIAVSQNIEYIAMIDIKNTKIMEVFSSQKDAALSRNLAGYSTISRAIKQDSISSGHYWKLFNNCSEDMRNCYLKNNNLPEKYSKTSNVNVLQIDPITNKELHRYKSITEVLLKYQMSRLTLKKYSNNNEMHNNYKWKIIENNL